MPLLVLTAALISSAFMHQSSAQPKSLSLSAIDVHDILIKSANSGLAGAKASFFQVSSLMWLRTVTNYQYKNGGDFDDAMKKLMSDGGVSRLYSGYPLAVLQAPLSRFGDTAANAFIIALFASVESLHGTPMFIQSALASATAGGWRFVLMPIDTLKNGYQVNGAKALPVIVERIKSNGWGTLFSGSAAAVASTVVGHYPWFLSFNFLSDALPSATDLAANGVNVFSVNIDHPLDVGTLMASTEAESLVPVLSLFRNALIGVCSSSVSDICSNPFRVLKVARQTDEVRAVCNYV